LERQGSSEEVIVGLFVGSETERGTGEAIDEIMPGGPLDETETLRYGFLLSLLFGEGRFAVELILAADEEPGPVSCDGSGPLRGSRR
jgi:hypothetical protein